MRANPPSLGRRFSHSLRQEAHTTRDKLWARKQRSDESVFLYALAVADLCGRIAPVMPDGERQFHLRNGMRPDLRALVDVAVGPMASWEEYMAKARLLETTLAPRDPQRGLGAFSPHRRAAPPDPY